MKKTSKILAFILALILLIGGIIAYPFIRYDIETYSFAHRWRYSAARLDLGTYVVTDAETYNTIFEKGGAEVDFEKEMVFLAVFTDCCPRPYFVDRMSVEGNTAKIYIRLKYLLGNAADAVQAYKRVIAVKTRKIDVENVEFYEWWPGDAKYLPLFN